MDVDVYKISDLLSLSDISKQLDNEEKIILDEVREILCKKNDLECKMEAMKCSIPDFDTLESSAKNSSNLVGIASNLALGLSGKVRQLDLAKNHVIHCVKRLDDILTLKSCALAAKQCVSSENYEEAAAHIYQYLCIDKNITSLADQILSDEFSLNALDDLNECQQKLVAVIGQKFNEAVAKNDKTEIDRYFKLFKLVGIPEDGLQRFGLYLSTVISKKFDSFVNLYDMTDSDNNNFKWIDLFTEIVEFIAGILKDNQSSVETYYGPGNLFILIKPIQKVCDHYVNHIIGRFCSQYKLDELHQLIKVMNTYSSVTNKPDQNATSQTDEQRFSRVLSMESVIMDMVTLNSRSDLYLRFLRRHIMADLRQLNLSADEQTKRVNEISRFFDNSKLVCLMQNLMDGYTLMEGHYLREMIIKAISVEEIEKNTKTWRYADDIFFVLKKCFTRSFSTGSMDGICAVVNNGSTFLSDYLINGALAKYIRAGFPSGWMQDAYTYMQSSVAAASSIGSSAPSSVVTGLSSSNALPALGSSASSARHNFLVTINSIQLARTNLDTLVTKLLDELNLVYEQKDTNFKKLEMCLNECKVFNLEQLKRLYDTAFEYLTTSVVRSQVKSVLSPFASMKYNLVEDDLDLFSANDPWIEVCITNLDNFLKPFRGVFSTDSNDRFLLILSTELQRRLEQLIQRKTFNRFGAVQLEKEIRCLFTYLTSISYTSLRDHFTRIFQICKLLNFDSVEEVSYFWDSSTWRLTPNEVRRFLSVRIDFEADEIRRLKL